MIDPIGAQLFIVFITILIIVVIYAAIKLRKTLRQFGEILAKQSTKREDGESGEAYNADADRNKDPR
jgi:hypothetical protein